jgi:hypothetical protein
MMSLKTAAATLAIGGLCLAAISPARAQYTNPYTGNTWNNANSSLLDTAIHNNMNALMLRTSLNNTMTSSMVNMRATRMRTGAAKIKKGLASTRIPFSAFQTDGWITRCGGKTPEQRRQIKAELVVQQSIWNQEMRSRGAKPDDIAQVLAVAFVLGWEAYSGQRATEPQYRWAVKDFRQSLMKDTFFQGMSAAEKQNLAEINMLSSTDCLMLRRASDIVLQNKGRAKATTFLDGWWEGPVTNLIATPTGFADRTKVKS